MPSELLAVIDAPHFYAGIVVREDRVIVAADIVRYMRGWSRDRVRAYCRKKGWKVSVVEPKRRRDLKTRSEPLKERAPRSGSEPAAKRDPVDASEPDAARDPKKWSEPKEVREP